MDESAKCPSALSTHSNVLEVEVIVVVDAEDVVELLVVVIVVVVVVVVVVDSLHTVSMFLAESQTVSTWYPNPHARHCLQHLPLSGSVPGLQPTVVPTKAQGLVVCSVL